MFSKHYDYKVYQSGLKFVLFVAVKRLCKCDIQFYHSLEKGIYTKILSKEEINADSILNIKNEMLKIINENHKFIKKVVTKKDAYDYYLKLNYYEKAGNILNLNNKTVTFYELMGYYNYFMSEMPDTTGELKIFDLTYLGDKDLLLRYPTDNDLNLTTYNPQDMIFKSFKNYNEWVETLKVEYVSDLNKIVSDTKIKEFIKKNDILMDNQIYELANIIKQEERRIILLGGPSSSGKTTSTRKLALYLSSLGLNPYYLGLDDYFKDKSEYKVDENGEKDFESLNAIDLNLFNAQLKSLLEGKKVSVPTYNFILGKKEYKGRNIELKENDLILIEGLHCLNEQLTKDISRSAKLKIYVSPFTPLSIDRHNHLSTTDIRLLRRMIRDNRTRGFNVENTLQIWQKVREGETKYVFPYTNEANIVLNTAHVYEVGILRVYAEPMLYSVPMDSEYYLEARRLINELQMFFPIPSEYLSDTNILREFVGGSYFEEGL